LGWIKQRVTDDRDKSFVARFRDTNVNAPTTSRSSAGPPNRPCWSICGRQYCRASTMLTSTMPASSRSATRSALLRVGCEDVRPESERWIVGDLYGFVVTRGPLDYSYRAEQLFSLESLSALRL
jgi:hypothetical protein